MRGHEDDGPLADALGDRFRAEQRALLAAAPPRFGPSFVDDVLAAGARARGRRRRVRVGLTAAAAALLAATLVLWPGGRPERPRPETVEEEALALPAIPELLPPTLSIEPRRAAGEALEFTYLDGLVAESPAGTGSAGANAWPFGDGGDLRW